MIQAGGVSLQQKTRENLMHNLKLIKSYQVMDDAPSNSQPKKKQKAQQNKENLVNDQVKQRHCFNRSDNLKGAKETHEK